MAAVLVEMLEHREHPSLAGYRLNENERYLLPPEAARPLIGEQAAKLASGGEGFFMPGVVDTAALAAELLALEVAVGMRDEMPAVIRVRGRKPVRYEPPTDTKAQPAAEETPS